jgi:hypothetical protein
MCSRRSRLSSLFTARGYDQQVGLKQERKFWDMAESIVNTFVAAWGYWYQTDLGPDRVGFAQASLNKESPKNCSAASTEISKNGKKAEL